MSDSPRSYVLIDFENVQPKNLDLLQKHTFQVLVFVGENQSRIPIELAEALQRLGTRGEYIRIAGTGRNALDFHIACYLGRLSVTDGGARFCVISRDKGFDPLLRHLKSLGIRAMRVTDVAEIPELRIRPTASPDERIDRIVRNLVGRKQSRPRKVQTLKNAISTLIEPKPDDAELERIVAELARRGYVVVEQGKVSYRLPA